MQIENAIAKFRRNYVGRTIRGQVVEDVGLTVETYGEDLTRWFVQVHFVENPCAPTDDPDGRMFKRLFSEIPHSADVLCATWPEAASLMSSYRPDAHWVLDDEMRGL